MQVTKVFHFPAAKEYKTKDGSIHMLLSDKQRNSFTMRGDTKIIFNHSGGFSETMICRIMFNTSFI